MKNRYLKLGAVLALVLFTLGGCGGSSSSTSATTTTTVAGATTTTAAATTTTTAAATTTTTAAATTTTTAAATTTTTTTTTTQPAQTTTGSTAFGILSTSSARIAILPTSVGGSSGATGAANGIELVSLGSLVSSSTKHSVKAASSASSGEFVPVTFSDGNGPDACSVDSSVLKAVCIELASAQIVILDLSTYATSGLVSDVVASQLTVSDLPSTQTSFSGVSCTDCGVITVPGIANNGTAQFVIAGYDGYHVYNYPAASATSISATKVYSVPISENLAMDPTAGYLFAPGYYSGVSGGRILYIINLKSGNTYAWTQATDSCNESDATQLTLCQSLASEEIDSFSVDPATQILTLQSESGNELLQLDLSQAVFSGSGATGTFTAPHLYVNGQNATGGTEMSGAISSPAGDYLFIAAEFGDAWVGSANLPASGGVGNVFPTYTFYPVYVDLTTLVSTSSSGCTTFKGGYDPHREATAISLSGTQFGVYASGDGTCLAVVNLGLLAAAPHTVSANLVDSSYNLVTNGVVTFVPTSSAASTVASQLRKNYVRHAQEVHRH